MEEIKKEEIQQTPATEKEYYSKDEVNDLLNKKFADVFGDLIKQINKQPEPKKEENKEPKEKTIDDFMF